MEVTWFTFFKIFRISIFWSSLGSIFPHFNPNQRLKNWYHFTFFIIALEKIEIILFDSLAPSTPPSFWNWCGRARDLHPHHIMPSWATIPWCITFPISDTVFQLLFFQFSFRTFQLENFQLPVFVNSTLQQQPIC